MGGRTTRGLISCRTSASTSRVLISQLSDQSTVCTSEAFNHTWIYWEGTSLVHSEWVGPDRPAVDRPASVSVRTNFSHSFVETEKRQSARETHSMVSNRVNLRRYRPSMARIRRSRKTNRHPPIMEAPSLPRSKFGPTAVGPNKAASGSKTLASLA